MTSNSTRKLKPADDEPFDFNLDAVGAEVELRPFRFHYRGQRWEMVHAQELNIWDLLAAADGGDLQQIQAVFRAALGKQWDEFRKRPLQQYRAQKLFEAYQQHSGIEPGESQGSTGS